MSLRSPSASTDRRRHPRGLEAEPVPSDLATMVLGTFREMPGLSLHLNQAARLFGVTPHTCQVLLDDLVAQRCLRRGHDGQYLIGELPTSRQIGRAHV